MAEYAVVKPPDTIMTIGLGSCVGIALYDPLTKIGGLVHIMLPINKKQGKEAKYADTGIPLLINEMKKQGAHSERIVAKIAGGAHMFAMQSSTMQVGARNVEMVKKILKEKRIKILGEDCGKNYGRTMVLHTITGEVEIKSRAKENITI
ncbi:MAG: chemotaxis protein CheD [bacterium]